MTHEEIIEQQLNTIIEIAGDIEGIQGVAILFCTARIFTELNELSSELVDYLERNNALLEEIRQLVGRG